MIRRDPCKLISIRLTIDRSGLHHAYCALAIDDRSCPASSPPHVFRAQVAKQSDFASSALLAQSQMDLLLSDLSF
jgi:hypothetical protein